uniref:Putative F-box protein n=1 Tax=Noccaea caerulescens TaxID=107243 RepID=A0A1J3DBV2_NOCCA
MFHHPDFTKFFLTRSSGRPRLLFAVKGCNDWSFYSSPQRQNPYEKSSSTSLEVAAEFHTKFPPENMAVYRDSNGRPFSCGYDSVS